MTPAGRERAVADGLPRLDPCQLQAVRHRGSHLLIVAGAGSGKTRTLASRAHSLLGEILPEQLMVVTFTNMAANAIRMRIRQYLPAASHSGLDGAWIGTIHSICHRMLRQHGHLIGLPTHWRILDQYEAEMLGCSAARAVGLSDIVADDILRLYSYARNSMTDWRQLVGVSRFPHVPLGDAADKVIRRYRKRCEQNGCVDFDDLQVLAVQLLEHHPAVRQAYQAQFRHIMVDEYQDTNAVQAQLLKLLACDGTSLTVVGDDAQSIYGFRAADVGEMLTFEDEFAAQRIMIPTCYRSTPEIITLANESIRHNTNQLPKVMSASKPSGARPVLFSGSSINDEADFVVRRVVSHRGSGTPLKGQAVLCRASWQWGILEDRLRKAGIPYRTVGGRGSLFSQDHIRAIGSVARLLLNQDDVLALSAACRLLRISSIDAVEELEAAVDGTGLALWEIAMKKAESGLLATQNDYKALLEFMEYLDHLSEMVAIGQPVGLVVTRIVDDFSQRFRKHDDTGGDDILEDLTALQTIAADCGSMGAFVDSIALNLTPDTKDTTEDRLTLSTIHGAKGLEWDVVYVTGLVESRFPHERALRQQGNDEEERRMFYVAVTRAKSALYLSSYAEVPREWEKRESRFVRELPQDTYDQEGGV